MKRSYGIHFYTISVLGLALGKWMSCAISMSSMYYGVLVVITAIAIAFNIICGVDK